MFDQSCPPDSAIGAFLQPDNIWLDEEGFAHQDLKDFGFTALQRETILINISKYFEDGYMCVPNNNGQLVEIYWMMGR